MKSNYDLPPTEERLARREARQAKQQRRRQAQRRERLRLLLLALPVLALVLFLVLRGPKPQPRGSAVSSGQGSSAMSGAASSADGSSSAEPEPDPAPEPLFTLQPTEKTQQLGEEFASTYALLADAETGEILVEKSSDAVISPASMTKILTLLVAAEIIQDWDTSFTMTREVGDYCYRNDCSVVGYEVDEEVPARELLYGTILPSGADAALGLAILSAGSHEAFVEKMNEKCAQLGLSANAHFTNCVGLYDPEHHCTLRDMALILRAAMDNDICRPVLTARKFQTAPTAFHPEGQLLSNWFLRRIEDKDCGSITVQGAKTGYVVQSGSCAASYGETADGRGYLCVTGDAHSSWRAIYDHVALYQGYVPADAAPSAG